MSDNVNNQYDFFKLVNLDNDGNLGVNVVGGGGLKYTQTESTVINVDNFTRYSLITGLEEVAPNGIDYSSTKGIGDLTFPANTLKKGDVYHLHMGFSLTTIEGQITTTSFEITLGEVGTGGGFAFILPLGNIISNFGGTLTNDEYDLDLYYTIREEGEAGTAEIYIFSKVLGQPFNIVNVAAGVPFIFSTTTPLFTNIILDVFDFDFENPPTLTNYGITLKKL